MDETENENKAKHIARKTDQDEAGGRLPQERQSAEALERITNETLARDRLGRWLAGLLAMGMGLLAGTCILFALYTGLHFLNNAEHTAAKVEERENINFIISQVVKSNPQIAQQLEQATSSQQKPKTFGPSDTIQLLAPLIPATFSSALGLIIIVTLARFIASFVTATKREEEKAADYGAIAALVKEVVEVVNKLRGK